MIWQEIFSKAVGKPVSTRPLIQDAVNHPVDNIDKMDKTPLDGHSVNIVNFVREVLDPLPSDRTGPASSLLQPGWLTREQCREVHAWPIDRQRAFTLLLDAFEAQGHALPQAEVLAYQTLITPTPGDNIHEA